MTKMASQITSLTVVYSTVYSDTDQRKHQSSASLAFVWRIHRDRWIPRTKSQLRGKCFHLMTSSWLWLCPHVMSIGSIDFGHFYFSKIHHLTEKKTQYLQQYECIPIKFLWNLPKNSCVTGNQQYGNYRMHFGVTYIKLSVSLGRQSFSTMSPKAFFNNNIAFEVGLLLWRETWN